MKIRFLGTGAADWAEPVNGEFRALSSALFDEKLLILFFNPLSLFKL